MTTSALERAMKATRDAYLALLKLKGKFDLKVDLAELRRDRER